MDNDNTPPSQPTGITRTNILPLDLEFGSPYTDQYTFLEAVNENDKRIISTYKNITKGNLVTVKSIPLNVENMSKIKKEIYLCNQIKVRLGSQNISRLFVDTLGYFVTQSYVNIAMETLIKPPKDLKRHEMVCMFLNYFTQSTKQESVVILDMEISILVISC